MSLLNPHEFPTLYREWNKGHNSYGTQRSSLKGFQVLQQWQRQLLQKQTKNIAFLKVEEEVEEEGLKKMTNNPCSQTWRQGGLQVAHLFQPTGHVYTRWAGTNDTNPVLATCGKWQTTAVFAISTVQKLIYHGNPNDFDPFLSRNF